MGMGPCGFSSCDQKCSELCPEHQFSASGPECFCTHASVPFPFPLGVLLPLSTFPCWNPLPSHTASQSVLLLSPHRYILSTGLIPRMSKPLAMMVAVASHRSSLHVFTFTIWPAKQQKTNIRAGATAQINHPCLPSWGPICHQPGPGHSVPPPSLPSPLSLLGSELAVWGDNSPAFQKAFGCAIKKKRHLKSSRPG